jgi:hypothetical protein
MTLRSLRNWLVFAVSSFVLAGSAFAAAPSAGREDAGRPSKTSY